MAVKRISESEKQTEKRRQEDAQSKKLYVGRNVILILVIYTYLLYRKRASLDSDGQKNQRQQERVARKQRRVGQSSTPIKASNAFTLAVQEGPDYVCVCCNRLMYRKTVQQFQMSNYDKAPSDFAVPDSVSAQDNH